jgi:hypothetical protein
MAIGSSSWPEASLSLRFLAIATVGCVMLVGTQGACNLFGRIGNAEGFGS